MDPMHIIGGVAVALVVLAYACGLTGFIVHDRLTKRVDEVEADAAALIAGLGKQIAELRAVVNYNADRGEEVDAFVQLLSDRVLDPEPVDVDEAELVDEPSTPAIWDRFATPLIALPPAPDVRTQLVDEPPQWAGATSIFNDLAASSSLHTVARAAAPEDTRLTTFTGDMAAYVRSITDPVDVDEHDDGCTCVECQYAAIARAELAGATA